MTFGGILITVGMVAAIVAIAVKVKDIGKRVKELEEEEPVEPKKG